MAKPNDNVPRPCACTTVRTTSRLLARVYDDALQQTDLNVTQLAVLRAIERMSGQPLSHVADALSMDRTSLYRAATTMQKNGWLQIVEGRNARSRAAVITAAGQSLLADAAPHWESVQTQVIQKFGTKRWQRLVDELRALAGVAQQVDQHAPSTGA